MISNQRLRLFLLAITNAGGEGKTFLILLLLALFELLDEPVLGIDTDVGNKAVSSMRYKQVKSVDPFENAAESKEKITKAMDEGMSLAMDAGANMQAASREFENMCRDLGIDLDEDGYAVRALWVVSTNKLAAAESATKAAKRIDPPFQPLFVFNDRDGSGAVPEGLTPDMGIPYLPPALVALVNKHGGFAQVVRQGIQGYQHSADMVARYLWNFADQPMVRTLLEEHRVEKLRPQLNREILDVSPFTLWTPDDDETMENLAREAKTLRALMPHLADIDRCIEILHRLKNI